MRRAGDEGWNWEDCGYRAGTVGLTPEEFWLFVKIDRQSGRVELPVRDTAGVPFTYHLPPAAARALHIVDTRLGGSIGSTFPTADDEAGRTRYLLRSLREEAISSSLIEGAVVTRADAVEMLRADRPARTHGERMVLNNYRTIRMLNERKNEPLTPDLLCRVQRSITDGTLDKPDAAGRFRTADEDIAVVDDESGERVHVPPPATELPDRVAALCEFANAAPDVEPFIHPAVRAITLNFWLAYDHPFYDGNGRTARALFYWSMLRSGYWLTEYVTVSSVIAGQPKQYAAAYLNTERDGNDATYFVLYHLRVIERCVKLLYAYLEEKRAERGRFAALLAGPFNPRQRAILQKALTDPNLVSTYETHANSHGVTVVTARSDLLDLESRGLLRLNKNGRRFEFTPAPGLAEKLRALAAADARG